MFIARILVMSWEQQLTRTICSKGKKMKILKQFLRIILAKVREEYNMFKYTNEAYLYAMCGSQKGNVEGKEE